jgi:hypothetical protein
MGLQTRRFNELQVYTRKGIVNGFPPFLYGTTHILSIPVTEIQVLCSEIKSKERKIASPTRIRTPSDEGWLTA